MPFTQLQETLRELPFRNLDLLSVGIVIAAIGLLGFVIYISNPKSDTNKAFLNFSIATIFWSIFNYLNYQSDSEVLVLWLLRFLMFSAVWISFTLFQLLSIFPQESYKFSSRYRYVLLPWVCLVSLLTLTPLVFNHIDGVVEAGRVAAVVVGPGIVIFAVTVLGLISVGIWSLLKRLNRSSGPERRRMEIILAGVIITFSLIITLDFLFAAFLNIYNFIPFGAFFIFPMVACIGYAIYKHHLFNIRAVTVMGLTFILCISSFIEVIFSSSLTVTVLRIGTFLLVLAVGIIMNRFVTTIAEQREDLAAANEGQTNLIHIMNHQVKGYLSKSRNIFAEMLSGDYGPVSDEAKPLITEGLRSLSEGVDFVQSVLNGSSAESGMLTYNMLAMDFKQTVEEASNDKKDFAIDRRLTFDLSIDDGQYNMVGDHVQLKEAVRNLVDNSIHYTPKGGITIHLARKDGKALLSVKDTGVGVTKEDMPRLFTKGGRGKDSLKINVNSTGYGLAFVKAVIEAHKGRVWVESEGQNKGSTFFIELPLA